MKKNKPKTAKPRWGRPKLIVIARGDRSEGVLVGCKWTAVGGPLAWFSGCVTREPPVPTGTCVACSSGAPS